jgi:hypothetical protein
LIGVDEPQGNRRALGNPAPLDYLPVDFRGDVADLLLAAQFVDRLGQPLDLLAQPQRGRQQLLGRYALAAQVVPEPALAVIVVRPPGQGLTRAWKVVESTPLRGLVDLLVDPRGEAHVGRLAFGHVWLQHHVTRFPFL